MKQLFEKQWQQLQHLNLSWNLLDEAAIMHLAQGVSPRLQTLNLAGTSLTWEAMLYLVHGQWPLLQKLDLSQNHLDVEALNVLTKGDWPVLETLDLSDNIMGFDMMTAWGTGLTGPCCQEAIKLLAGDSGIVLKEGVNRLGPSDKLGHSLWPGSKLLNLGNNICSDWAYQSLCMSDYDPDNDE